MKHAGVLLAVIALLMPHTLQADTSDAKARGLEIATQAGRLYDSFVNLTNDLLKVGSQLNTVKGSYDGAMKKLTGQGNLITRVEKLKKLGAKANKNIDDKLLKRALDSDSE